jgi:hypothetical protein
LVHFFLTAPFVLVDDGHETNPTPITTAAARSLHYPHHHPPVIIVFIGKSRRRSSSRSEEMSFGKLKKTVKVHHVNVSFLCGDDTRGETTTTVQQPHDSKKTERAKLVLREANSFKKEL